MLDAVLEALADSALAGITRGFEHAHAVVGMDLLKRRGLAQLAGSVAEHALVRRAVVQAASFDVDQCDHVGGVFGDDLEDLVFLAELAISPKDPQFLGDHDDGERSQRNPDPKGIDTTPKKIYRQKGGAG